jgi:hypothetical protein
MLILLNGCQSRYGLFKNTHLQELWKLVFTVKDIHYLTLTIFTYIHVLFSAQGVVYPAMHAAIAHWGPPNERSKFLWCTIGRFSPSVLNAFEINTKFFVLELILHQLITITTNHNFASLQVLKKRGTYSVGSGKSNYS